MSIYNTLLPSLLLLFSCDPNPYGETCVSSRGITYLTPDAELLRYYKLEDQWSCSGIQRAEDSSIDSIQKHASKVNLELLRGYTVRYVNSYGWRVATGDIALGQADWSVRTIYIRFGTTCASTLTHEFLHVVSNYDSWWLCGEPHCDWSPRGFDAAISAPLQCAEPQDSSRE